MWHSAREHIGTSFVSIVHKRFAKLIRKLCFKIFADDTNVFASARDLKSLEGLMNSELAKIKKWCDINKLAINMAKTNFMIIKSARKRDMEISLNISNSDGSS